MTARHGACAGAPLAPRLVSGCAAGRATKVKSLTVELNALYTVEQLLTSPIIRHAVRYYGLEVHAAVLNERTGDVEFVGRHPQQQALMDEARYPDQATIPPPAAPPPTSASSGRDAPISPTPPTTVALSETPASAATTPNKV